MDESISVRRAGEADLDAIVDLLGLVFHETVTPELRELEVLTCEVERSLVADDAGTVVGHTTTLTRDLTVPGAVIPAAHVTGVGVAPTHRRRGLLTALMRRQLTEIAAGNEPVAVLWASESAIYPRYGYGPAASRLRLDVPTREVRLTPVVPPAGRLRMVEPAAATAELAAVFDGIRARRVGWSTRDERRWRYLLADLESRREGATRLQAVLCDGPDGPLGYATWRVHDRWSDAGPDARVRIEEIVADDPATYAALWSFLLGIDLARTATYSYAAVDEPLQYLVDEPRRLGGVLLDSLWVRLVDLPAALEARRYAAAVDVVLQVTDPLLEANSGRWRLTGGPDKASCTRTDEAPDLACTITDLGAAYLGGTTLGALAAAGRVERLSSNLPSAAFGWERLPSSTETF